MKGFLFFLVIPFFLIANNAKEDWGKNLYIVGNYYDRDDRYLKLSDGSYWNLNFTYREFTDRFSGKDRESMWLAPDEIEIRRGTNHRYPYILVNLENNEMVEARQFEPLVRIGSILKRLELKSSTTVVNEVKEEIR